MELKKGYTTCVEYLEKYVEQTYKLLLTGLSKQKTSKSQQQWKYELMCPIIIFMENMIDKFTQLQESLDSHLKEVHELDLNKSETVKSLKKLKETVDKGIKDNLIDETQSLIKFEQVMFPKESNQQVYIGSLDSEGKRCGKGALSDGIMLYNGDWENDKRHGFGIQVYDDGEIFAGQWHYGKPVIGRWVFDDQKVFYGIFNRTGDEETEWMLGLSSEDYLKIKKAEILSKQNVMLSAREMKKKKIKKGFEKVRNIFYHEGEASGLMNVFMKEEDKINVGALTGDNPMEMDKITFLDGIMYKGMWKNFEPNLIGLVKVPNQEPIKLLTRTGRTLAYKRLACHPKDAHKFEEKPSEKELVYMISQKRTLEKLEITFKDGTTYIGSINENLEFNGYGVLKYPNGDFDHGIFTYNDGFYVKFSKECFEEVQRLKDPNEYFTNSYGYLEENSNEKDIWVEVIEGFGEIKSFLYKGGWYDFNPEGRGYIKFHREQKRMVCTANEQLMFNIIGYSKEVYLERIEASMEDEDSDDDEMGNDIKNKVNQLRNKIDDYEFGDGSR